MKLYPKRQRCLKCRRYFGPLVVLGLYCSFSCAGTKINPGGTDNPRACENNGQGKRKRRWDSMEEAAAFAARDATGELNAYQCYRCGGYHVGHNRKRS